MMRSPGSASVGIEFLGPDFSEPQLLRLAYAYEQATQHRAPPRTTPHCSGPSNAPDTNADGVPDECETRFHRGNANGGPRFCGGPTAQG